MAITSRAPIFPIPEETHCGGDYYGFDDRQQMDFFRRVIKRCAGKRAASRSSSSCSATQFKPHRAISKEESRRGSRSRKRSRWWSSALRFWKWSCRGEEGEEGRGREDDEASSRAVPAGHLYATESHGSSWAPPCRWRKAGRRSCGAGDVEVRAPYISLRSHNFIGAGSSAAALPLPQPIYLVT